MSTTINATVKELIKTHLGPMANHAEKAQARCASFSKNGVAMLVGSGGTAYANYIKANPQYAGQTIVVVEWYKNESYESDAMSMGPAVSMLATKDTPICQHIMTLDEARKLA